MIIDAHVHLYSAAVNRDPISWAAARGETRWAAMSLRTRKDGRPVQAFPGVDNLLREMDRHGIERSLLLGWYWEKAESCAEQNIFLGQCVRAHPDRLMAFGSLQPRAGQWPALAEMHRVRDYGLIGIGELSPHAQGYAIDDPVFLEILQLASDWRLPVNFHVTDPETKAYPGRVETPLPEFAALARDFPRVDFILSHWGGLLPLRDASVHTLSNLYYDTAASPLMYDTSIWERFRAVVPAEKILWGSDFPLNLYPRQEGGVEMGRFLAESRAAGAGVDILGGNAVKLFRI